MLFDDRSYLLVSKPASDVTKNFRFWQFFLAASALLVGSLSSSTCYADNSYDLTPRIKTGDWQKVKLVLEVVGELKLNADGKKVTRLPLKVRGEQLYGERVLQFEPSNRRSIRHYETGQAVIQVGEHKQRMELSEERRLVLVSTDPEGSRLVSPLGPLTRDELELLDVQGNSSLLFQLLPHKEIQIGDNWSHSKEVAAELLRLEAVHELNLQSTLRKVEGQIAVIDLKGSVSGAIGGVSTDIELKAVYNFNLHSKTITWLAMTIKEDRAIGHAQPGFEVTARLRVAPQPCDSIAELHPRQLGELQLTADDGSTLLKYDSREGGFAFHHTRSWYSMVNRHDVSILRYIDRGDLIAQCNASNLTQLESGKQVELAAFQADVMRALGDNFGQFVESSQSVSEDGIQILRTVVSGVVSDLPIQWTYYHLSNQDGRQVSIVFTMDSKLVERFAGAEQTVVSTFQFTELPTPAELKQGTVEVKAVDATGNAQPSSATRN